MTNDTDPWRILEFILTALFGVAAGVRTAMGWFTGRELEVKKSIADMRTHLDKEITSLRDRLHNQGNDINGNTLEAAVIKTQQAATTERLSKIERCMEKIDDKQDEQMDLLIKIYKEKT